MRKFTKGECNPIKNGCGGNNIKGNSGMNNCYYIYQDINQNYNANEKPAYQVSIDMYQCANGAKSIENAANNPKVRLASDVIIEQRNKILESAFGVPTKLQSQQDTIGFTPLDESVFVINANFDVKSKKGRVLCTGKFDNPNNMDEVWGNCVYNNKSYCVRMTSQKGFLDALNRFIKN